ncbi:MAG: beta-ketoacyl synthase chain length factor [Betaproteobacteria bacterium]
MLAGDSPFAPGRTPGRAVDALPPTERRRINETSRLACLAAGDALAALPPGAAMTLPSVFASSDGDGVVLAQVLNALAQRDVAVSPTAFHNSVYNAPAGYWSIATRASAPSTTVCADSASFAVALLEGYVQLQANGGSVLVVAVDAPYPEPLRDLGASVAAFSCALVLECPEQPAAGPWLGRWTTCSASGPAPDVDGIASAFAGNSAAAALPLLRALARRDGMQVALPYVDGTWLELEVSP